MITSVVGGGRNLHRAGTGRGRLSRLPNVVAAIPGTAHQASGKVAPASGWIKYLNIVVQARAPRPAAKGYFEHTSGKQASCYLSLGEDHAAILGFDLNQVPKWPDASPEHPSRWDDLSDDDDLMVHRVTCDSLSVQNRETHAAAALESLSTSATNHDCIQTGLHVSMMERAPSGQASLSILPFRSNVGRHQRCCPTDLKPSTNYHPREHRFIR
ncbi:hypothetical protein S7711_10629 [Stachybotrys chartarum IBT 7711]|uniref:Uncharacterized protein n=1 Tax=Stachybotrys chartarum (strain CBS 109288 / IBT 7711) TaxID=1280523 RepID=A0A084AM10_STACB|nr:hypothetical protein S7711_10629 [Stachybotrys chartarum IBT 7711]KFA49968.1 hypothetical protein S40293_10474 [Stachybotrys chartarum IBT 40293]